MRKNTKVLAAVVVAGVVAATGSAFTASNTVVTSVAGYGTNTVTGATTSAVSHTLSADGDAITASAITFSATQAGRTVVAGFGTADLQSCTVATDGLSAACTYAGAGYVTASATAFNVAVS